MKKRKPKQTKNRAKKTNPKYRVRSSEVKGVIFILIAIFLLLSLISYSSTDPSWASVSTSKQKVHNYLGKAGASLSEALLQLFGFASFILPLAFLYFGILSFLPDKERPALKQLAGTALLLIILSSLFCIFFPELPWADMQAGGLTGSLTASILLPYFNHTGSLLVLFSALILFIIFSTHLSVRSVFYFIIRLFNFLFKEVRIRITHYRIKKHKEKMRKKVTEKYSDTKQKAEKPVSRRNIKKRIESIQAKISQPASGENILFPEMEQGGYSFPPLSLLDPGKETEKIDKNELFEKKQIIEDKFLQFQVEGEVKEYHPGPIVTTYEYYPHPHIKVSQVVNLSEDLSLALGAQAVRIQRIPGKSSLGIEIPNNKREIIKIRDIIQTDKFLKSPSKLTIALGKSIHGEPYITDLSIMPHLLIAGATGTGKSITLNTIIASILYKATPDEVKIILIDPKRIEFSLYEGMPHLLCPIVKNPKKAEGILLDAINKMEERYQTLGYLKVRNIDQYNREVKKILNKDSKSLSEEEKEKLKPLPYIVIIIDELSELMMAGAKEVEYCIARLAQLARAVGIHLVMATQRPSADVITGTIKNNFSSRIALRVPSKTDSRVIIDANGADKLLGNGDMLFMPPNFPRIIRLHSSFISLSEVTRLLKFVKEQGKPTYDKNIIKVLKSPAGKAKDESSEKDALFEKAAELILLTGQASASYLQRKLKLGYARAARIMDQMEAEGIVGPSKGSKAREILVDPDTYKKNLMT